MTRPQSSSRGLSQTVRVAVCALPLLLGPALHAQDASTAPVSVPAHNVPSSSSTTHTAPASTVSAKQAREAEDAYLDGAKQIERNDLLAADRDFSRAVKLNPEKQEYALALAVTREHRLTALVQNAAKARLLGDHARADELLNQARALDPSNAIITQHLGVDAGALPAYGSSQDLPGSHPMPQLAGPIELAPAPGRKSIHRRGSAEDVVRAVYTAFGINVDFDTPLTSGVPIRFDLDDADFATATHVLEQLTNVFAVAVQPKLALIAKNTAENRDRLVPQLEETIYLPGVAPDTMTELATLARNVFDLKQVTSSPGAGDILVRGDEPTLKLLNATYADMLDGGSDVLLDIHLYEIDKSRDRNVGAALPSSAGVFSLAAEAQSIVSANQAALNLAIANGLTLPTDPLQRLIAEVAFLFASGAVSATQFTNLLGTFGNGLTYAGLFLGSSSTFNLLLNSSDVRTLDDVQVRIGNGQASNFRAGTRYPIVTATYSSGVSSTTASALAGLNVNGTSVSSLLSQYLGTNTSTVPQIQYEDLGLTLKATPHIDRTGSVSVLVDMKIEALGSGTINSIPILNNRQLTSTITIPSGETALLASAASRNEMRAIDGLPGLSELPGFQGTEKDVNIATSELLITITPHVVREGHLRIASRRLSIANTQGSAASQP